MTSNPNTGNRNADSQVGGTDRLVHDLTNRVAIITGGSRGLGRAMAQSFAAHGATVVIASRKLDACEQAASEIAASTGATAVAKRCHVGDWEECSSLVEEVTTELGGLHVLVNNAGMSPLYESLGGLPEALFDKVLDVNLKGPFRLATLAAEHMAANGGGSIINVTSTAAVQPSAAELPYGAAKAGLQSMSSGLARSFGPEVRVNTIMPGPFLTDISKAWDMDAFDAMAKREIPLGRGGHPDEIVGAALYLASDASSYTTGSVIKVDGGMAWRPG